MIWHACGETNMPPASQPIKKIKLWAINPRKQTRKSLVKNNPKPTPPRKAKVRRPPASRPPARKNSRLPLNRLLKKFQETDFLFNCMVLKLRQGQIWQQGAEFIRIVHLERLEVGYKTFKNLKSGDGEHHLTSKKDFCRLLKSATLLEPKVPGKISTPPVPLT
jgi:hypothetical protein